MTQAAGHGAQSDKIDIEADDSRATPFEAYDKRSFSLRPIPGPTQAHPRPIPGPSQAHPRTCLASKALQLHPRYNLTSTTSLVCISRTVAQPAVAMELLPTQTHFPHLLPRLKQRRQPSYIKASNTLLYSTIFTSQTSRGSSSSEQCKFRNLHRCDYTTGNRKSGGTERCAPRQIYTLALPQAVDGPSQLRVACAYITT